MTGFERSLVKAFNRHFDQNNVRGIAYRRKQHRFSSQFVDVLVDSIQPEYYLAIENKSLKTDSSNKLYFSQHFSESDDGHQVERISEFLKLSGRNGFLAVELKRGRGKQRQAYLVPWSTVAERYENDGVGLSIDEIREHPEIQRDGETYNIPATIEEL